LAKVKGGNEMKKEEILKKSIEENRYLDEKQQREVLQSFGFGGIVVAILCVFFSIVNVMKGQRFYEFSIIIFGYLAGCAWSSYMKTKKKNFLIQVLACSFVTILGLVAYFLQV
jgi:uncharacterized membrane protein YjjP (DUF1212 family)